MSETPRTPQTKYWLLFIALFLLAAALILPPLINMNRYQRRIADAISSSLGRRVHLSSVTLHLLPRPGLSLSDFVVEEDPAFGFEPTLRSSSVNASIRLSSLWRGRLEIGRISFDQPSLNLVRNREGRWNIGTVLLQASHISNAPTAQRRAGSSPRFPYIEASNARVNFKIGSEKKPFSLLNADFAMWLANSDEWRLRLEAQPVRTDLDLGLSDTGLLRVEGSLHRAAVLGSMPIDLETRWTNAPLGQISRLLLGQDAGWRGGLDINGTIKGDVFNPQFKTRIRVAGMHRQEFTTLDPFNVDATCQGAYLHDSRTLKDLTCLWPIDNGHLLLTGAVPDMEHPEPGFNLQIQNVPADFGLSVLRLFRNGFAPSTQITGTLQGNFSYTRSATESIAGEARLNGAAIRVPGMDAPMALPALRFASLAPLPFPRHSQRKKPVPVSPTVSLHLANASIPFGEEAPLVISGDFTRQSFMLHLSGDASLQRLLPVVSSTGLLYSAASALAPQGSATLDLTIGGPWLPETIAATNPATQAVTEGTIRLKNAEFRPNFLPESVDIVAATGTLTPRQIAWSPVSVVFHKIPATVSVDAPIPCMQGCIRQFTLSTPQLDAAALQSAIMGAGEHGEFLQQILSQLDRNKVQWPALHGTVHTAAFTFGPLILHDASSDLHIEGRSIQLTSIKAHILNGILEASGAMDASGSTPRYSMDAQLLHANAAGFTALWHEPPLSGTVSLHTHLELVGFSADDLTQSAKGTFHWDWTQGTFVEEPAALTHFDHWSADGSISNRQLTFRRSEVTRGPLKQAISGTISFDRKVNLTVAEENEETHVAKENQHAP